MGKTNTPLVYHINLVGKELICSDKIIVSKYDNKSIKLRFYLNDLDGNQFVAYKHVDSTNYTIDPLDSNNEFTITSAMTLTLGTWQFMLVSSSVPLDKNGEYDFDNCDFDSVIFTSFPQKIEVKNSFLENEYYEPDINENLEILYNEIVSARKLVEKQTKSLQKKLDYADYLIEQLNLKSTTASNNANNAVYEIEMAKASTRYGCTFNSLRERQDNVESVWVLTESADGEMIVNVDFDRVTRRNDFVSNTFYMEDYNQYTDDDELNNYTMLAFDFSGVNIHETIKCKLYLNRTNDLYVNEEGKPSTSTVSVSFCIMNPVESLDVADSDLTDLVTTFDAVIGNNEIDLSYAVSEFVKNNPTRLNCFRVMLKHTDPINILDRPEFDFENEANKPRLVFTE